MANMVAALQGWLHGLWQHLGIGGRERAAFGGEDQAAVVVYVAAHAMEAELVKALLASEGIDAYTSGEALSQVFGLSTGPLAEVKVLTATALAERARSIIAQHEAGDFTEEAGAENAELGEVR